MNSCAVWKYLAFAKTAARLELTYRAALLGRLLFFVVVLLIFSNFWRVIFGGQALLNYRPAVMLWYLFVTECIVLSVPRVCTEVEEDVRSGNIAYFLIRPVGYHWALLSRGMGVFAVRVSFFAVVGGGFVCIFSGSLPGTVKGLACQLALVPFSVFMLSVFDTCIGLSALWFQEATPLLWIWHKLLFILGGLMIPLSLYPDWLERAASVTPFYAALYSPARLLISFDWRLAFEALLLLALWSAAGLLLLHVVFNAAQRRLSVNGG